MKFAVAILVCALIVLAYAARDKKKDKEDYEKYKKVHGKKTRVNQTEEDAKLARWVETTELIAKHNQRHKEGKETFELGSNFFDNWTPDQISAFNNLKQAPQKRALPLATATAYPAGPAAVDWRSTRTLPIRNQGNCGSCW